MTLIDLSGSRAEACGPDVSRLEQAPTSVSIDMRRVIDKYQLSYDNFLFCLAEHRQTKETLPMSLSIPSARSPLSSIVAIGLVFLTACAQTPADQSKAQSASEVYTLDASNPTIPLTGDVAVWGIENMGPSPVFIRTAADPNLNLEVVPNQDRSVLIFAGDQRYAYTLGLGAGGTAAKVRIGR